MTMRMRNGAALAAALVLTTLALTPAQSLAQAPLRVCADPGNMPLSNNKGQGLENKLADVLGAGLGTGVTYYYRPGEERGMIRNTLDADLCDVMLDMPSDADDVLATTPLYRTTFVFVSRSDRNIHIKNLDDPVLHKLKIGVYETSAIREALSDHGVSNNIQIHYLSHDGDLVAKDQPSYQIQQVIDGSLDVAAAWGPLAGYYKVTQKAPLTIQPANMMDDVVPLQYDMSLAVRRGNRTLQKQLEQVMHDKRDALRKVLDDFGVPLVQCEQCVISGELPAHGPYSGHIERPAPKATAPKVTIAQLNDWLAHGANVNTELNNAVLADDQTRVGYLLEKKHADVNGMDLQGETPLHHAIVQQSPAMLQFLIAHGADANERDRDGWTPIMTAAYTDDPDAIKVLVAHGADPNAVSNQKMTALGVASQYAKDKAALALLGAGADPGHGVGEAGYTPLMLASANDAQDVARALIQKGADVNARNSGGVTALMMAAANGRVDMINLLVKAGANLKAQTDRGDTALSIAQGKGDQKVIALLGSKPGA
jgi:quinoprotein dehydrogenase-associated probable ABC transporter substrate-binding protein